MVVFDDGGGVRIDDGAGLQAVAEGDGRLDIEQAGGIRQGDADFLGGDEFLGPGDGPVGESVQDFQAEGGFAADGAEGGRDGQADHAGARDADAHAVLEDVAADGDLDGEIGRLPPQGAFRTAGAVL